MDTKKNWVLLIVSLVVIFQQVASLTKDSPAATNINFSAIGVDYLTRSYPRQSISVAETFVYVHPSTGFLCVSSPSIIGVF